MSEPRAPSPRIPAGDPEPKLPLDLPPPPVLPGGLRPDAALPCEAPFDAPGWRFAVDWEGMRCLLFAEPGGSVRLQDERLRDVTALFPDVRGASTALGGRAAVLDGIVAILDPEGRPDLRRLAARLARGAGDAAGAAPVVYLATDLLHLDTSSLLSRPLRARREALAEVLKAGARVQLPQDVGEEGVALAEAAHERGLPAIVARRDAAAYHPGVPSTDRLRIPLEGRDDLVVAAVLGPPDRPSGALLAEWSDGRLVCAGRIEAAWPAEQTAWLARRAAAARTTIGPFRRPEDEEGEVVWLRPELTVTVRHGGRGPDGSLRFPVPVALRDDREPTSCVRRRPLPPPAETIVQPRFRPTVINSLPLEVPTEDA